MLECTTYYIFESPHFRGFLKPNVLGHPTRAPSRARVRRLQATALQVMLDLFIFVMVAIV